MNLRIVGNKVVGRISENYKDWGDTLNRRNLGLMDPVIGKLKLTRMMFG